MKNLFNDEIIQIRFKQIQIDRMVFMSAVFVL